MENKITCNLTEDGLLDFYRGDSKEFQLSVAALRALGYREGVDFKIADGDEIQQYMRTEYFEHGLWIRYGLVLNPLDLCRGLGRVLKENGGQVFEQTPVIKIFHDTRQVSIETEKYTVTAKNVILATDAFTIDIEGLPHAVREHISPVLQTVAASTPLPKGYMNTFAGWTDSSEETLGYAYGRLHEWKGKRRLLIGEGTIYPTYGSKPKITKEKTDRLLKKIFPGSGIRTEIISGGYIGQTPDEEGLEGHISEHIYLCRVTDGILAATEDGERAALHTLGLEKDSDTPYRHSVRNTLFGLVPDQLKDTAATVYLKYFH